MKRNLQNLTFGMMRNFIETGSRKEENQIIITPELLLSLKTHIPQLIAQFQMPFLIADYRMGFIRKGSLRVVINLIEQTLTEGQIQFLFPGTIVQPLEVSDDLQITGLAVTNDYLHIALDNKIPEFLNGPYTHWKRKGTEEELNMIKQIIQMLWDIETKQSSCYKSTKHSLIATLTHLYNDMFSKEEERTQNYSNERMVFNRFISLVHKHCKEQRHLSFYAEQLCLSQRYLGTIVKNVSGKTAKEWIDRAVITSAKVMLSQGNQRVAEIADELNFSNVSFFCKYFRRLTGKSPSDYRE